MKIEKKLTRDAAKETNLEVELYIDKYTGNIDYLNRNGIPVSIAKKSDIPESTSFLTTTVVLSADEIKAAIPGEDIKELIPAPGEGKYISVQTMIAKFKNVNEAFNSTMGIQVVGTLAVIATTSPLNSLGKTETIALFKGNGVISGINGNIYTNTKSNAIIPTTGDGDIIFEIEYQILDF